MDKNNAEVKIKEIIDEASYFGLGIDYKWLVVTNADFFGTGKITDGDNELLNKYLENPNERTNIIFTTLNGIDLRKKIVKSIKPNTAYITDFFINIGSIVTIIINLIICSIMLLVA